MLIASVGLVYLALASLSSWTRVTLDPPLNADPNANALSLSAKIGYFPKDWQFLLSN